MNRSIVMRPNDRAHRLRPISPFALAARALVPLALVAVIGCGGSRTSKTAPATSPPLFGNLGMHHRAVTTESQSARRYFDQGLVLMFAFNHDEAIRSFQAAATEDPDCAMAWWGIALANGPHINNPGLDEAHSKAAWEALEKARSAGGASDVERALIAALSARYAELPPIDRKPLDAAYADAMRSVWEEHGDDADIGALFAEAMMDLRPWDLWKRDGQPQPGTGEILATLESVLARHPEHPLANHLYVHAVEASPKPERGIAAADRLRALVPGAGHLVHMPAHIDCRVGRWADASEANERAIAADRAYRAVSPRQGFYTIYMAHNHHFLAWASMMEGRSEVAIRAAREMIAGVPADVAEEIAFVADGYMTIAFEALIRFGRWEEILREPEPASYFPITTAHRHFARGVAFAATGRVEEARQEQQAFLLAGKMVSDDKIVGNNSAKQVLAIAYQVLDGEILYREGKTDDAVAALRAGAAFEDSLRYNEAPDWLQPVRHTLGGVLLDAGRVAEAEAVYREDLERNVENGWSLFGLARCLEKRNAGTEARDVQARFKAAWARADVPLETTCFCLTGK